MPDILDDILDFGLVNTLAGADVASYLTGDFLWLYYECGESVCANQGQWSRSTKPGGCIRCLIFTSVI
jgi:hypothetical protein